MTKAWTADILGVNVIDLNALPEDHSIIAQNDDYVSIRAEYRGGATEYTAYYNLDDALYERDALLLNSSNPLHRLQGLLKDNLFDSKDWRSGGIVERVEWLLSMYESKKAEIEYLEDRIGRIEYEAGGM